MAAAFKGAYWGLPLQLHLNLYRDLCCLLRSSPWHHTGLSPLSKAFKSLAQVATH